jgi:hypothetical protein
MFAGVVDGIAGTVTTRNRAEEGAMVDFKRLSDRAKDLVQRRGGTDSLKEDAAELKDIATGKGSVTDKAKAAAAAIKDPGRAGAEGEPQAEPEPAPAEPTEPAATAEKRAERQERRAERRKERAERREGGPGPA